MRTSALIRHPLRARLDQIVKTGRSATAANPTARPSVGAATLKSARLEDTLDRNHSREHILLTVFEELADSYATCNNWTPK